MLSRFKPAERAAVQDAVALAAQAVLVWARHGVDACMNRYNGEPKPERPKKEKPPKDKTDSLRPRTSVRTRSEPRTPKNEPAMPVNSYECLFLLDPTKSSDLEAIKTQLHGTLEKYGAEILASRKWDDRKLAYPIRGHKKGVYYLTYFKAESKRMSEWSTISG